jgi:hypothetical protein
MGTLRTIRPADRLESDARRVVIVIAGVGKCGWKSHGGYLLEIEDKPSPSFSQRDNCPAITARVCLT